MTALTDPLTLLRRAQANGGGLELSHVFRKAGSLQSLEAIGRAILLCDPLRLCLAMGWLERQYDPDQEPEVWFTLAPAGETLLMVGSVGITI